MEAETTEAGSRLDTAMLAAAFVLLAAAMFAFYYFANQWMLIARLALLLAGVGASVALIYRTTLGRVTLDYLSGARTELRKVVWPTRQESLQMTLLVAGFVLIAALMMWGLDSILLFGVQKLTGRA